MCCGTNLNSYATLINLRAILINGSILDTRSDWLKHQFKAENPQLIREIMAIKAEIQADGELSQFIRRKFAIKNTSGYSLNAFLDFDDPLAIIEHLLIGSEGTLGFISQVTLTTVADHEFKALNLLHGRLSELIALTMQIDAYPINAIELLDSQALFAVRGNPALAAYLPAQIEVDSAAIMIELTAASADELAHKIAQLETQLKSYTLTQQTGFIQDKAVMETIWLARKGVLPAIAATRNPGSSVIIEDIAVPLPHLASLIQDLQQLLLQFDYTNAAIFGHVRAGNIHFVITPTLTSHTAIENYNNFMQQLTSLVVTGYQGSLKAEHGSGRNIAPFAKLEWGEQCHNIMWRIKQAFDPKHLLNKDVKLTTNPNLHLENLKPLPVVDPQIDACMECGFCEAVCPARSFSLTPRQRIAVARKLSTATSREQAQWRASWDFHGINTCATTGMCQTTCPVGINTGAFIKQQIKPANSSTTLAHPQVIAATRRQIATAQLIGSVIGKTNLNSLTKLGHKIYPRIPVYLKNTPELEQRPFVNSDHRDGTAALATTAITLIPSCPSRIFAPATTQLRHPNQVLLEKLGYKVNYPANYQAGCCGQMYTASGNLAQARQVQHQLTQELNPSEITLIDNSSCAQFARESGLKLIDFNQFIITKLRDVPLIQKYRKLALHIDCSSSKDSFNPEYLKVLHQVATEIVTSQGIHCCGFAGSKGFTTPELNQASVAPLRQQLTDVEIGVTFNRNCQIGLTEYSGVNYLSLSELILNCWQD
jgi:D-lactate dehydrogenase